MYMIMIHIVTNMVPYISVLEVKFIEIFTITTKYRVNYTFEMLEGGDIADNP